MDTVTAVESAATVTRSVEVAAPPATVWGLLTDLDVLAELAYETHRMRWKRGDRVAPGAVFTGGNRNGRRRWTTTCTVTQAVAERCVEWTVSVPLLAPVSRWRYDIEPTPSGCRVTESTWDLRSRWFTVASTPVTGVADRTAVNARNIEATLQRLRRRAERG